MKPINQKVDEKVKSGKALTRRELAFASGYSYEEILEFSREAGFPIFRKKTRYAEFWRWRRSKMGVALNSHKAEDHQQLNEHRSYEPTLNRDLLASLPPKAARLLEQVS